jgi:hypothetical protein
MSDIYIISNYTDDELFNILDLTNPSDRELEAKIMELIKFYENSEEKNIIKFFNEIYNHFFETDTDNTIEEFTISPSPTIINSNKQPSNKQPSNQEQSQQILPLNSPINLVSNEEFSRDKLNPLLKQTITRIVSIDSQYRENKSDLSTLFTLNLSEPLKDVVTLKLYSFHIPYTWYTISNSYGSNFFILKGSSPGINNGYHDYKFEIQPGNYTSNELVTTVNNSIINIGNTYKDVDFGNTSITYNTNTAKSTLTIDITKNYNENNFKLYFPTISNTIIESSNNSYTTIPSFFGFIGNTYNTNLIYSNNNLIDKNSSQNNISNYVLDTSNNTFTIVQYQGIINNGIIQDYSNNLALSTYYITLDLSINQIYSRNQLENSLNNVLQNNQYLESTSNIERIQNTINITDTTITSYYVLKLILKRSTTITSILNLKTVVIFPNVTGNIWVGDNSCFGFSNYNYDLDSIISEYPTNESSIIFSSPLVLYFKNINDIFNTSINDISLNIINIPTIGYSLISFTNIINSQFNNQTIFLQPPNDTKIFSINNSLSQFYIGMQNIITKDKFYLEISGSFISDLSFNTGNTTGISSGNIYRSNLYDLSNTSTFTSSFIPSISYTLNNNYSLIFYIKSLYSDIDISYSVSFTGTRDLSNLQQYINNTFNSYSQGNVSLIGSTIKFYSENNLIYSTLNINITKTLTQNDYQMIFIDPSETNYSLNSWNYYLHIKDYSYNLIDYSYNNYSIIMGNSSIYGSEISINETNNTFFINPIQNIYGGAYTGNNYLSYNIPYGTYTLLELYSIINTLFSNNSITQGSVIKTYTDTVTNTNYTKLKLNINKTYKANDYELVFYDSQSFVKCYVGTTSVQNVNWDNTLGWILGFRQMVVYSLNTLSDINNKVTLISDTTVSVNLFNYLLIVIDDYNQNHLNDGLTTITGSDNNIPLPSYSIRMSHICDPITGNKILNSGYNYSSGTSTTNYNKQTQAQIYSTNQIYNSINNTTNSTLYSPGPNLTNVFAIIPLKVSSMTPGQVYSDFGGSLQNQTRSYFGPVNIKRLSIKLYSDKGTIVDLNNSNWSFSFLVEQLYQQ